MKIFDDQFAHAVSAGTPYLDTKMPFLWDRNFNSINKDEILFFTESNYDISKAIKHDKKILWVLESPFMVSDLIIQDLIKNYKDFYKILTHDDRLIHLPNSIYFPIGGCWIKPFDVKIYKKDKLVSTVVSNKIFTEGQAMRQKIAQVKKIDVFGPNFKKLEYKLSALERYKFHVCIENIKNNFYFTEKIIDCFATGTIPIYWGSQLISKYFNSKGIIIAQSLEEIYFYINNLQNINVSKSAIEENFHLAKEYFLPEDRISSIFSV